ncbi:hypothetical protein SAMN04488065_1382 [Haloplanus vescus]|uniref:Uncharacterized protein n=1 Tax=Haloplanus vescus TaxID=555874 RepID=A0A1H3X6D6_9EURY|nr:hypothetical protein [Haloplanus vescus]SDZ94946.1 hypothetical protein SAMN04488065_1382 [Haloplanus vescus]
MSVRTTPSDRIALPTVSRYDLLLALMPIPLLCGVLLTMLTPVSETVAMGAGSLVSAIPFGYAISLGAPTTGPSA